MNPQAPITHQFVAKIVATPKSNQDNFMTVHLVRNQNVYLSYLDVTQEMINEVCGTRVDIELSDMSEYAKHEIVKSEYDVFDLNVQDCTRIANIYHLQSEIQSRVATRKTGKRKERKKSLSLLQYVRTTDYTGARFHKAFGGKHPLRNQTKIVR